MPRLYKLFRNGLRCRQKDVSDNMRRILLKSLQRDDLHLYRECLTTRKYQNWFDIAYRIYKAYPREAYPIFYRKAILFPHKQSRVA